MELVQEYWEILVAGFLGIVTAVKLLQQTQELRKDVDDINRRDMYTETVKLRATSDVHSNQITELWAHVNDLRNKVK